MQAPVFTFLTSWPLEDLISQCNDIDASTGQLFDRLEASIREDSNAAKRCITCAHLQLRCKPKRPPPRVIVFTGPAGAAKRAIMAGLVASSPNLFARVVTHTCRRPKAHEVDGVDYHFTDAPTLRYVVKRSSTCTIFSLSSAFCSDAILCRTQVVLHLNVNTSRFQPVLSLEMLRHFTFSTMLMPDRHSVSGLKRRNAG